VFQTLRLLSEIQTRDQIITPIETQNARASYEKVEDLFDLLQPDYTHFTYAPASSTPSGTVEEGQE
jgi:hypothetical protein